MIYGWNISEWNSISNSSSFLKGSVKTEFGIHRATQGMRDDQSFTEHHNMLMNNCDLRGAFWWLNHDWAHNVKEPWVQAENYWQVLVKGGRNDYNIPPIIDIEGTASLPLPDATAYINRLKDAVDTLSNHAGRMPILYSNWSIFEQYLNIDAPGHEWMLKCGMWIASPRKLPATPTGSDPWELWQFALDVKDWPGIDTLDGLNRWPGTKAQMLQWTKDPSMKIPEYDPILDGGGVVPDPDPEPDPEPVPAEYSATVTSTYLNIRDSAGREHDPLGRLWKGATVDVGEVILDGTDKWRKFTGYIGEDVDGTQFLDVKEK